MKLLTTLEQLRSEATAGIWKEENGFVCDEKARACMFSGAAHKADAEYITFLHNSLPAIQEYITLLEGVAEAADLVREDLIMRAEMAEDGVKEVDVSCSRWIAICDSLSNLNEWKEKHDG